MRRNRPSTAPANRRRNLDRRLEKWSVHNDVLSKLQNPRQLQNACRPASSSKVDRNRQLNLATPSVLLRGRYALPTLMTPPRSSSGYSEGEDLHKRKVTQLEVARRRAEIYSIHDQPRKSSVGLTQIQKGKTKVSVSKNYNGKLVINSLPSENSNSVVLGEREIIFNEDHREGLGVNERESLYLEIKREHDKRNKALMLPNWGQQGNEIPRDFETFSVTVKKTRPQTANPRTSPQKRLLSKERPSTAHAQQARALGRGRCESNYHLEVEKNMMYEDSPIAGAVIFGKNRRIDTLSTEVDRINAKKYKERLRLFQYCKEKQWRTLMQLANVMANARQDGDQGQRMFVALSAGFAANESAPVNVEQLVSRCTSFGLPWWQAEPLLRTIFICFDDDFDGLMDWRDFVSALRIVVRPREPMAQRLRMFFNLYCDHTKYLKADEIIRVFTVHIVSPQVTQSIRLLVQSWLDELGAQGCSLSEVSLFLRSKRAEETMRLLAEDWFRAMPDGLRFHIVHENYKDSEVKLKEVDDGLKMKKALGMWMGQINNMYFRKWCYAVFLIHGRRRGGRHFIRMARMRGLRKWRVMLDRRKGNRVARYAADKFRYDWLTMRVFRWWKIMYHWWLARNAQFARRGYKFWSTTRKEYSMLALKMHLEKRRGKRKALEFWEVIKRRNLIRTWRANVAVIIRQREAQERSGALRAKMTQDEIDADVTASLKRELEEYERNKAEEAARKEREEAEKEEWARQKMVAYERGEERRIRRLQREEWARLKAKEKEDRRILVDTMLDRLEITVRQQAEYEALDYMASAEGKKMIRLEMEKVKKEGSWGEESMHAEGSPMPEEGEDPDKWNTKQMIWAMNNGIEMVKMIDAVVGEVFFYNVQTGERLGTDALSTQECRKVARKNYIDRKVHEALSAMRAQRDIDERRALENKSSTIISNTFRIVSCKRKLRAKAKLVFAYRTDKYTGEPFYYNTWTLETQTKKPYALGNQIIPLPEWIVLRDPAQDDKVYYKQTIAPFEVSWDKPAGWLYCMRCQAEFAERRCRFCGFDEKKGGEIFCLYCWMDAHPKTNLDEERATLAQANLNMQIAQDSLDANGDYTMTEKKKALVEALENAEIVQQEAKDVLQAKKDIRPHPWKEVRRIATYCFMCRTTLATKVCWECGCDAFCDSHFKLMHNSKRNYMNSMSTHTGFDI
jgi:hypothetical protein